MPERDELDLLIDSALRDYAAPRPGLERRMVARMAAHRTRTLWHRWILALVAAPVFAALLFLSYLITRSPHSPAGQRADAPAIARIAPVAKSQSSHPALINPVPHRVVKRDHAGDRDLVKLVSRPKLDVFPTPQPLTGEEKALIRFVAETPEADRKAFVEAQQQLDEPLIISAMHIPPLQITDETH